MGDYIIQDAIDIADAIEADRFHGVSHDWGAIIAWALASKHPARLLSLTTLSASHLDAFARVLAEPEAAQRKAAAYFDLFCLPDFEDGFLYGGHPSGFPQISKFYAYGGIEQEAIDQYLGVLGSKQALGAALNWYKANIKDRTLQIAPIGNITVPTLYVWSDGDTALIRDGAVITGEYVDAEYQFVILKGVTHWIPDTAAAELTALLVPHIKRNSLSRMKSHAEVVSKFKGYTE